MKHFKEIVMDLQLDLERMKQTLKSLEKTGEIKRSDDGYMITKYFDSYGLFMIGEISIMFHESNGFFMIKDFCKKYNYTYKDVEDQIKKHYKLNNMEFKFLTVANTHWINHEYAEFLLRELKKTDLHKEQIKLNKEKILLVAKEQQVPEDIVMRHFSLLEKERNGTLTDGKAEEAVNEISSWVSVLEVAEKYELDLEATLIAATRIVGNDRLYPKHFYKDKNAVLTALSRKVISPQMVKEIILDSEHWLSIADLSDLIDVSVERIIKTYDTERRKKVNLYPIINKFDGNSILSEREMIEEIIYIETKVNPHRNYLDEWYKTSMVGTVPNPPNSKIGKYLSKKGRKGRGHF